MRRVHRSIALWSMAILLIGNPGTSQGETAPVTVTIPAVKGVTEARLWATAEAQDPHRVVEKQVEVPFSGKWDLDETLDWKIRAEATGFWSFPVEVAAGEPASIELALVPAGRIEVKVDELAGQLLLELASAAPKGAHESPLFRKYHGQCSQLDGKVTCVVPAGLLDMKLSQPGLIPRYLWSIEIPANGQVDLGMLRFAQGASIAGWVVSPTDGRIEDIQVVASPLSRGFPAEPSIESRAGLRALVTRTNERGFFQLGGLAPGYYELSASGSQADLSGKTEVEVQESAETRLTSAIEVLPPIVVELRISPALDPYAQPWSVQLGRLVGNSIPTLEKVVLGESGIWSLFPQGAGLFDLTVRDSGGSSWHSAELDLIHGQEPLFVDIERLEVEGRIRRGDEPVTTRLVFGSTQGAVQLEMQSDAEGIFSGFLPRSGAWQVDLAGKTEEEGFQTVGDVEVEPKPGSSRAFVEIDLPDTVMKGRVIQRGQPVEEAQVMVLRIGDKSRREGQARTNAAGEFQIRGLEPGGVIVRAIHGDLASEWLEVEIAAQPGHEILIDLTEKVLLSGQVLSGGQPVYGAVVLLQPHLANRVVTLERAYSLLDGEFQVKVPAEAKAFDVLVRADGYGTQLFAVTALQTKTPLIIDLDRSRGRIDLRTAVPGVQRQAETLLPLTLHFRGAQMGIRSLISIADFRITDAGVALIDFAPGAYRICDTSGKCKDGQLPASGEAIFEIEE